MRSAAADSLPSEEGAPTTPEGGLLRVLDRMADRLTRRSIIPISIVLTLVIGVGDRATGIELPFTILYLLPIGLATWFGGRRIGLLLAILATLTMLVSLLEDGMSSLAITWNVIGSTAMFLAAAWVIDQLRSHVEREHAQRRLAVDQLRHAERLNVIGTLAAGVAHELGTPLSVITGCAEFLIEGSDDDQVQKRATMIQKQVAKISAIIRHLLDFGRAAGVTRSRVDLAEVSMTTAEMLRSTARRRSIEIHVTAPAAVYVNGNASELEQVLSNLLLNAVQATDHGSISVRVSRGQRSNREVAVVEVEDRGHGIRPADLSRIFDPFFTTKGIGEGTGLGLSVSYGIIRDHGGAIEVASELQRGSRFTVVLPLQE